MSRLIIVHIKESAFIHLTWYLWEREVTLLDYKCRSFVAHNKWWSIKVVVKYMSTQVLELYTQRHSYVIYCSICKFILSTMYIIMFWAHIKKFLSQIQYMDIEIKQWSISYHFIQTSNYVGVKVRYIFVVLFVFQSIFYLSANICTCFFF